MRICCFEMLNEIVTCRKRSLWTVAVVFCCLQSGGGQAYAGFVGAVFRSPRSVGVNGKIDTSCISERKGKREGHWWLVTGLATACDEVIQPAGNRSGRCGVKNWFYRIMFGMEFWWRFNRVSRSNHLCKFPCPILRQLVCRNKSRVFLLLSAVVRRPASNFSCFVR